jgi:hypothetical protein
VTAVAPDPTALPPLRIRPIPDTEPPPDPEPPDWSGAHRHTVMAGRGQLALALLPSYEEQENERLFGPQPSPRAALPDPQAWTMRIVQALVECLAGERPVNQLLRWTSIEVYAALQRRCALASRSGPPPRRGRVRRVRVSEPIEGVIEACAVVIARGRVQAMALRMEGLDGRWQVTALEVG